MRRLKMEPLTTKSLKLLCLASILSCNCRCVTQSSRPFTNFWPLRLNGAC